MIETAGGMHQLRKRLGWSVNQMALALGITDQTQKADGRHLGWNKAGARVLDMERGVRQIDGPTSVALEAFAAGFIPRHFRNQLEP